MALKPLEVLRKGLKIFENRVKAKKEALQAQLAERKSISSQDEQWLDHDANLVDELRVLEALEDASDYERGFARLDDEQNNVVRRLQEAAGNRSRAVGKKRKRASIFPSFMAETDQPQARNMHTEKPTSRRMAPHGPHQFSPRRRMRR
jgi:GAF domain-containing protein